MFTMETTGFPNRIDTDDACPGPAGPPGQRTRIALLLLCLLVLLATAGCGVCACSATSGPRVAPAGPGDLDRLVAWMIGAFSSSEQAAADSEFRDVRLHMVPIWTGRVDGRWLYVEQAIATTVEAPYRQRVYRITERADATFESAVYKLPEDPLRWAGAWKTHDPLSELDPSDLEPRTGCSIILAPTKDGAFEGSTIGNQCPSDLRGAAYATSEVRIESGRMVSWDRGFDEAGKQVWGATKGGYRFIKEPM